jgi:hypothetical protein
MRAAKESEVLNRYRAPTRLETPRLRAWRAAGLFETTCERLVAEDPDEATRYVDAPCPESRRRLGRGRADSPWQGFQAPGDREWAFTTDRLAVGQRQPVPKRGSSLIVSAG